jgi:hypothetical protein
VFPELTFQPSAEKLIPSFKKNSLKFSVIRNPRNSKEESLSQLASLSMKFADITPHALMIQVLLKLKI